MKVQVSEATPIQLDWMVLEAAGFFKGYTQFRSGKGFLKVYGVARNKHLHPTTDWSQGGPIIERIKGFEFKQWLDSRPDVCCEAHIHNYEGDWIQFGPTPLIAAMRCYVASRLGAEVDVPDELI